MKQTASITLSLVLLLAAGCDSFLDRQPDEQMTSKNIFLKQATTLEYLVNVYSFIQDESDPTGRVYPWEASSDEVSVAYTNYNFQYINRCTWQPNSNLYRSYTYQTMYRGIREANYFMQHVDECPELSRTEAQRWYAEARFLRAYYYFCLMKVYGPVILVGDEPLDFNDLSLKYRDRSPWDECVDYVAEELRQCASTLPEKRVDTEYGRATRGAALAVRARLLLYAARPLFNGGSAEPGGRNLYLGMVNHDGKPLFPQSFDPEKWKRAADAAKEVIDLDLYELLGEHDGKPYESLKQVALRHANDELIFVRICYGSNHRLQSTPRGYGGRAFGGVSPTQKLVDAFAMDNGYYPITGYEADGTPRIDERSGYAEEGFSLYSHPNGMDRLNTFRMYQKREPRFYVNIFWSGMTWRGGENVVNDIQFFNGGNSGPGNSHNYSTTGYLCAKFIDPELDSKAHDDRIGWGFIDWPLFRYAEVLLNYAEALNEYDPGNPDALATLNRIRRRAGVPDLEEVYPEAVGDKAAMRELIRRERMVELCYENQRYFDTRTWMISPEADNGTVYGMNIMAPDHRPDGTFWRRTPVQAEGGQIGIRLFRDKSYLFPFPQAELDRVTNLTQNYGW